MYNFRLVKPENLALIRRWRELPHVVEWWGAPDVEPEEEKLEDPRISMWIVEYQCTPFAFIQDYAVHGWDGHHFSYLPERARGLDVYIGEPSMLNQGHGSAMIARHTNILFEAGVPAVGIDPNPENRKAIRAYEKAGFSIASQPVSTPWGPAILMEAWARNKSEKDLLNNI